MGLWDASASKNWEGEAESNFGITSNCMALDCIALDAMALHGVTMVTTTNEQTSEYRATQLINTWSWVSQQQSSITEWNRFLFVISKNALTAGPFVFHLNPIFTIKSCQCCCMRSYLELIMSKMEFLKYVNFFLVKLCRLWFFGNVPFCLSLTCSL